MTALPVAFALVASFVAEAQITSRFFPAALRPDLILAVVLVVSILMPRSAAVAVALVGGALTSAMTGTSMGGFIVSRVMAAFAASVLVEPLNVKIGVALVAGVVGAAVAQVIYILVQPVPDFFWSLNVSLFQSLETGALVALMFPWGVRFLSRKAARSE